MKEEKEFYFTGLPFSDDVNVGVFNMKYGSLLCWIFVLFGIKFN